MNFSNKAPHLVARECFKAAISLCFNKPPTLNNYLLSCWLVKVFVDNRIEKRTYRFSKCNAKSNSNLSVFLSWNIVYKFSLKYEKINAKVNVDSISHVHLGVALLDPVLSPRLAHVPQLQPCVIFLLLWCPLIPDSHSCFIHSLLGEYERLDSGCVYNSCWLLE